MKKKLLFLMAAIALFVPSVMAAEVQKEGGTGEELLKAFNEAKSEDVTTIKLTANIENYKGDKADNTRLIVGAGKTVILDLNGHNISIDPKGEKGEDGYIEGTYRSIIVEGGKLTIKGKGTITHETHVAVNVWALNTGDTNHTTLIVEKDVTLVGKNGISVFEYKAPIGLNTTVDFYGKINAYENGITINGNIQTDGNVPVVNIKKGAEIKATREDGVGIYGAGNGIWNIEDGVKVEGVGSAIGVKAGTFNINGGTFTATGNYDSNPKLLGGDITPSGAAIQLETNSGYYGHIKMNIKDGVFTSEKGTAILEYGSDTTSAVEGLKITDGEFNAAEGKEILAISKALKTAQANNVISIEGGLFSNKVENEYLGTDKITITIAAAITENGETVTENIYTVVGSKGDVLDEDAVAELEDLLGDIGEGYKLVGYYSDSELKNKFDFSKEMNDNTTIYMSFVKDTTPVKTEKNPKTSDMNLALILASLGLASTGAVLISRKKLAKTNR